ncbi:hypothetical protein LPUS_10746 [Lasallia pustulata]|uniref:Uncharacterized protein n=1 Tax=Lasallia pustulata TaxID=136370 RepID=A0A1W5DAI5_9LECA|nr:hypothetical protein LPUS_10746 [Lasallia pustulata]
MVLCGKSAPNCTLWALGIDHSPYQADPDIAGSGVVAAFIASAAVTLLVSHTGLLFNMIESWNDNAIDDWTARKIQRTGLLRISDKRKDFWRPVMEKVVLSLSDQQLIAGLAILTAGFLKHCSISVYHFAIVTDLAWFSSNVHLTTLNVLTRYHRARPTMRNWRVCLMVVTLVMMLAATVLQGHWAWYDSYNCDAQCLFDDLLGNVSGSPAFWMELNIFLLVFGYGGSFIYLYEPLWTKFEMFFWTVPVKRTRSGIVALHQKRMDLRASGSMVAFPAWFVLGSAEILLAMIMVFYVIVAALLGSTVFSLYVDILWFAYGLYGIITDRASASSDMAGNENEMGFGQIVAILLLASTILTCREAYVDELIKERSSEVMPTVLDRIKPLADTAEDLQMTFANEGPPVYPWEPEPVLRQRRVNTGDQ